MRGGYLPYQIIEEGQCLDFRHVDVIWAIKPTQAFLDRVPLHIKVFVDVLDGFNTVAQHRTLDSQVIGYRYRKEQAKRTVWVASTPSAAKFLNMLGTTAVVPHSGDKSLCTKQPVRQYDPEYPPFYWGYRGYIEERLREVSKVFGRQCSMETGVRTSRCGPMLNLRGGRYNNAANSTLKPQVKLSNAILYDVPLISSDCVAGQSLAELWDLPYIIATSLHEAHQMLNEAPLILIDEKRLCQPQP